MKIRTSIRIVFKRVLQVLFVMVLGLAIGVAVLHHALKKRGVTWEKVSYSFPSSLAFNKLYINREAFSLSAKTVEIEWSWGGLFTGKIISEQLTIDSVLVEMLPSKVGEMADTLETDTSMPVFDFKKIEILHTVLIRNAQHDSLNVTIPSLTIKNLSYDTAWRVGHLISRESVVRNSRSKEFTHPATESSFLKSEIPSFVIDSLEFEQCAAVFRYDTNRYAITEINLQLNAINNNHLLDATIQKLAFKYQDSLNVSLAMNELYVNGENEATLTDFVISLPGIHFDISAVQFSNNPTARVAIQFNESSINPSYLRYFSQRLNSQYLPNSPIDFSGNISYQNRRIDLKAFALSVSPKTHLRLDGVWAIGTPDEEINLTISGFHTSLHAIAKLFHYKLPATFNDMGIKSDLHAQGTYENLHVEGTVLLGETALKLNSNFKQGSSGSGSSLTSTLSSNLVKPGDLMNSLDEIRIAALLLHTNVTWRKNQPPEIQANVVADSVLLYSYWLPYPKVEILSSEKITQAVLLAGKNDLDLRLQTLDNIWNSENEVNYNGTINLVVPRANNLASVAGELYADLKGRFYQSKKTTELGLSLDSIRLSLTGTDHVYYNHGDIAASVSEVGDIALVGELTNNQFIRINTNKNIVDWWNADDKWNQRFPMAQLDAAINIDSVLMEHFMGYKSEFQLTQLSLSSTAEAMKVKIDMPRLRLATFGIVDLDIDYELKQAVSQGKLSAARIDNPCTTIEQLNLDITTPTDNFLDFTVHGYLPAIQNQFALGAGIVFLSDGYKIGFGTHQTQLGDQIWQGDAERALFFDRSLSLQSGSLQLARDHQTIRLSKSETGVQLNIDSVDLHPFTNIFLPSPALSGTVTAHINSSDSLRKNEWTLRWGNAVVDSISVGTVTSSGSVTSATFQTQIDIKNNIGNLGLKVTRKDGPFNYSLNTNDIDLHVLSSFITSLPKSFHVSGTADAQLSGTYDSKLDGRGFIALRNTGIAYANGGVDARLKNDTVWMENSQFTFRNIKFYDRYDRELLLTGKVSLDPKVKIDASLRTSRFRIFDQHKDGELLKGAVDISTDLHGSGTLDNIVVKGNLRVLPEGTLTYVYGGTVSLDDREKEIRFESFNTPASITTKKTVEKYYRNPFTWNVNYLMDSTQVTILFDEAAQDYVKATVFGGLQLRTGLANEPLLYGSLRSNQGSIFYNVPMISDLNFQIDQAVVSWNGELTEPRLTFRGSEPFRITPSEISFASDKTSGLLPIEVIATVKDRSLTDFDFQFDLNSSNAQVGDWIQTLPEDTRQAYAISLMLFGRISTDAQGQAASLMQNLVGKMNEISRRNINNADLSFYVDRQERPNTTTTERLGFSFSKGFFHKKVRVSLGGDLDVEGSAKSSSIANVKVEYFLRRDPDLAITASKGAVYTGVIDGQVDETSLGVSLLKSFRNLFYVDPNKNKR